MAAFKTAAAATQIDPPPANTIDSIIEFENCDGGVAFKTETDLRINRKKGTVKAGTGAGIDGSNKRKKS